LVIGGHGISGPFKGRRYQLIKQDGRKTKASVAPQVRAGTLEKRMAEGAVEHKTNARGSKRTQGDPLVSVTEKLPRVGFQ